jgi:hypothetical protein
MKGFASLTLFWSLVVAPAHGNGIDNMYSPDTLSEWQIRIGSFIQGVYGDIIKPVLSEDEQRKLAALRFDFPASAPGQEPLAFWRSDHTVHLSAASMKFVGDILLAYVWLGRNGYVMGSLDDYLLMLACWKQDAAPPPPRIALHVPDNAREDQGTDVFATRLERNAYQFIMLHELGHALHDDVTTDAVHTTAQEIAADSFALDVLGRLHQVPTGVSTLFQLLSFYEVHCGAESLRHSHPFSRDRLRAVSLDLVDSATKYAKDLRPDTIAAFHSLASMTEQLADQMEDPKMQALLRDRAPTISPAQLAPRRPGQ